MKKKKILVKEVSVPLHFKELVEKVRQKQNLKLGELTEFYLVDLLSRFLYSTNLFPKKEINDPLALQLYKAIEEKSIEEKISILKKMGDFALYISGFFGDYLGKKSDMDYYISMGGGAYGAIYEISRERNKKKIMVSLFKELSVKFEAIVSLLNEISELSFVDSDKDIVRIYEKWVKTKKPSLKEKLTSKGIISPKKQKKH